MSLDNVQKLGVRLIPLRNVGKNAAGAVKVLPGFGFSSYVEVSGERAGKNHLLGVADNVGIAKGPVKKPIVRIIEKKGFKKADLKDSYKNYLKKRDPFLEGIERCRPFSNSFFCEKNSDHYCCQPPFGHYIPKKINRFQPFRMDSAKCRRPDQPDESYCKENPDDSCCKENSSKNTDDQK